MATETEFSDDEIDVYDEYFGDDSDRDPDFSVEKEMDSCTSEDEQVELEKVTPKQQKKSEPSIDLSSKVLAAAKNNQQKDSHESSSSDFDYPDDFLDVPNNKKEDNTTGSRKRKRIPKSSQKSTFLNKKYKQTKNKVSLNEIHVNARKQQTLDYKNYLHLISNLDLLLLRKYDNRDYRNQILEYVSAIFESNEHNYILNILPTIFNRSFLYEVRLMYRSDSRNDRIHFQNFCFGVRKYLETVINVKDSERENISKKVDEAFRHLTLHKEKQFCLMLACHYYVQR